MVFPGKARLILATTLCLGAAQPAAATPSERLSAARLHCEGSSQQLDPAWTAEVASALQPGSAACRALVAGESPTGEVKAWIEHKPRKTLSFEGLMGSSKKQATAPLAPAPAAAHVPTQIRQPQSGTTTRDPRKQLQLDFGNIDEQRQVIKIHDAQLRIEGLGSQMREACRCLGDGSCFDTPQFGHSSMNEAMANDVAEHDIQLRSMCNDWREFAGANLPEELETLTAVEGQLQAYLDGEARMQALLHERADEFHAEERRIARAQATAEAQRNKKGNGFLAALTTMTAGAVLSDKLGFELNPEALAKTSIAVGKAVDNGEGMGAAFGEGVTGLSAMVRSATPIAPRAAGSGDDYIDSALSQVKSFPAPSATSVPGGLGPAAPSMNFTGLSAPALPASVPDAGVSDASIAEANRYMAAGHDLVLNQQSTPGGGQPDAFGVPDPTVEKISYVCRIPSNVPLADGNGGVKYYYENEIELDIRYWIPECGEAKKAYYIANGCNRIDDMSAAEARCQQACGSRDCRSTKYEQQIMNGLAR